MPAVVLLAALSAAGQTPQAPSEADRAADPLAARQQIVRDRMVQLEDRMFRLAEKLTEGDPDQARRLADALRNAGELLIRRNMEEAIGLLERAQLADAAERQVAIENALEQVLKVLLEQPDLSKELQKEIERLKALAERVDRLLEQQRELEAKTRDPAAGLAEAAARLQRLIARQQRDLEKQASQLADEMQGRQSTPGTQPAEAQGPGDQRPPEPGEQAEREQENQEPSGEQAEQPPAPGGQNVRNASGHMNRAAGNLDRNQQAEANQDQQRAIEELQRAQDELRQTLDQLRREQQEEMLRGLEQRFRAMLAGQKAVNEATDSLAARDRVTWTRSDLLNLAGLVQDEKKLGDEADAALNLLVEEATTVVFPQVVAHMRSDMLDVARRLGERDTGDTTREIEGDIVRTLEELIEAVKRRQSEMADAPPPGQQDGQPNQPGQQNNPLLPSSAELKLLKSSQVRINRQTRGFEESHPDTGPLSLEARRELERLAARQEALAEMARQMNERETGR